MPNNFPLDSQKNLGTENEEKEYIEYLERLEADMENLDDAISENKW